MKNEFNFFSALLIVEKVCNIMISTIKNYSEDEKSNLRFSYSVKQEENIFKKIEVEYHLLDGCKTILDYGRFEITKEELEIIFSKHFSNYKKQKDIDDWYRKISYT
tara:strand:- start:205 stop:522 length:318 start_codon:yes stop_codon:yes gene_type:complete